MALVGIGVIPEESVLGELIDFRLRWRSVIGGPLLGMSESIPHITIYQFPFESTVELLVTNTPGKPALHSLQWTGISYQAVGWVFANTSNEPWMTEYQGQVVAAFSSLLDRSLLKSEGQLAGYSELEKENYLKHGYRYVGEAFRPHVTLGRTYANRDFISSQCVDDFAARFVGREVPFSRVVLYRAGTNGELVEIIETISES